MNSSSTRWSALLLVTGLTACSSDQALPEPAPEAAVFDESAANRPWEGTEAMVARWGHPGTTVAAIDEAGALWLGASGYWDPVGEVLLDASRVSKAGSITKTQVAAVLLQLVGEQVLPLDDDVSSWWNGLPDGDAITVRDLLRHSSGLPGYLTFIAP